jgi:hypothetical protein
MQLLSADSNIVQCVGESTGWRQLAAILHHAYSYLHTYQEGLIFHYFYCVNIRGTSWVKYKWTLPEQLTLTLKKLSEYIREEFLQNYVEPVTSIRCTNISDIFHLNALWFCFCFLQHKIYLRAKGNNCQYNLPSNSGFAPVLSPICIFFKVQVFILQLWINNK